MYIYRLGKFSPFSLPLAVVVESLSVPSHCAPGDGQTSQTSREVIKVEIKWLNLLSSLKQRFHHITAHTLHHTVTDHGGKRKGEREGEREKERE